MSTPTYQHQLFELERMETALGSILESQGMTVHTRFGSDTDTTPRVELVMSIAAPEGHRFLLNPRNSFAPAQPFDSWSYTLAATIVTERTRNGDHHVPLIGKVRYNLQYFRLIDTLTAAVSPFHTLTSIDETGQQDSVDDEKNLQLSQITFRGVMNIRESAWLQN